MSDKLREKIKSVGTTLDDYVKGLPNFDQKVDNVIGKRCGVDNDIILSSDGVVRLRNESCVSCGSSDIVFNGTNPKVLESGLKIRVQRYLCNKCQCNFTTPLEGYLKKNKRYSDQTIDSSVGMRVMGTTLRKVGRMFLGLVGFHPSHETVRQWSDETGREYKDNRIILPGSGVYCYDEQHLRIGRKKHFRMSLIDAVQRDVVNESVEEELKKKLIKDFLLGSFHGKIVWAVVTDGDPQYDFILKEISKELRLENGIIHQLCTFHALKNLSRGIHEATRDINKRKLDYPTDYKNLKNTMKLVFNLDDKEAIEKYMDRLPEGHNNAFQKVIDNQNTTLKEKARRIFDYIYIWHPNYHPEISKQILWIHNHWNNLTHFYQHPEIPKTNNPVEQHYSNTNPHIVKRKFKNPKCLENYLFTMAAHRNQHLSLRT